MKSEGKIYVQVCKLCGETKPLVKSHIIPEAFWREVRNNNEIPLLISSGQNQIPKKAPIGVYDNTILCAACEVSFGKLDDYGIKVLLRKSDELFQPIRNEDGSVVYIAKEIDQQILLKFFVSVIWRASISVQPFYKRINIESSHKEIAKKLLRSDDEMDLQPFGVVLSRWQSEDKNINLSKNLMAPFQENLQGVNTYRVYFGKFTAHIKVDDRDFPYPLNECALGSNSLVVVAARNFSESREFEVMRDTVRKSNLNVKTLRRHFSVR